MENEKVKVECVDCRKEIEIETHQIEGENQVNCPECGAGTRPVASAVPSEAEAPSVEEPAKKTFMEKIMSIFGK